MIANAISLAVLFVSCASTGVKGTGFDMQVNKPVIIDYKGQAFGSDLPGWVLDAADGNTKNVQKALKLTDSKVWILQNNGQDLDMLKLWTDQVDGRAQIASGMEQSVADLITAELEATENIDNAEKEKQVKEFSMRMSNITLNGLEKVSDYWTKTRTLKQGLTKAKSDADFEYKYTYLVVFSMDEKLYDKQLRAAMNDIDANDDQSIKLREAITRKLENEIDVYVVSSEQ